MSDTGGGGEFVLETLSVKMTGDDSGYKDMLKDAQQETQRAASSLRTALGDSVSTVGTKIGTAGQQIQAASNKAKASAVSMAGGFTESAGAAVTALGSLTVALVALPLAAVAVGAGVLFKVFYDGITGLEQADLKARQLGVSLNTLRTATIYAGAGGQGLATSAITSVQNRINQAQLGYTAPSQQLQSLAGASGGGAMARDFREVVEQLERIKNPAERAAFAFRFMGDSAGGLLEKLNQPGGLKKAEGFAKSAGLLVSDADLENVRKVGETIREIQTLWKGFLNQVVLGLAPFARALSEAFDPKNIRLDWIKEGVFGVTKAVITFGAYIVAFTSDSPAMWKAFNLGLKMAEAGFLSLKAVALEALKSIASTVVTVATTSLADFAGALAGLLPVGGERAKAIAKAATGLGALALAPKFEGFSEEASRARKESDKIVADVGGDFKKLLGDMGKKPVVEWADELIAKARKFADEATKGMDKLNDGQNKFVQAMTKDLDSFKSGLQIPGQSFLQDIRRIFTLQGRSRLRDVGKAEGFPEGSQAYDLGPFGMIRNYLATALPDVFKTEAPGLKEKLAFRSYQGLLSSTGMGGIPRLTEAAEFRSQGAVSAESQFQVMGRQTEIQERILAALEVAKEQRQAQVDIGAQVLLAIQKLGVKNPALFSLDLNF